MRDHDISQRRPAFWSVSRHKTVQRERPPDNPEMRKALHEIAAVRRRFSYRRPGLLLERRGMLMNPEKLSRHYGQEGLAVKRQRGRKCAPRHPHADTGGPGAEQRWSLDFVADTFGASRKFGKLAAIDDCCRENLCLIVDSSISGARVARKLDALVRIYGKPACVVSDNGTEFTSRAILKWAEQNDVVWHYIDLGKPQ